MVSWIDPHDNHHGLDFWAGGNENGHDTAESYRVAGGQQGQLVNTANPVVPPTSASP